MQDEIILLGEETYKLAEKLFILEASKDEFTGFIALHTIQGRRVFCMKGMPKSAVWRINLLDNYTLSSEISIKAIMTLL